LKVSKGEAQWPELGLEPVATCPVCGSAKREILFDDLADRTFFVAPGRWTLKQCTDCRTGYLDPRPTADTIGLAYTNYYTHERVEQVAAEKLSPLRLWQRKLANGYKNRRFETRLEPSSNFGPIVASLMPENRLILDRQFRELERGKAGRVLDIGCGDGSFLDAARAMGWEAVGTDFDLTVVEQARKRGLEVYQGTLDDVPGTFDAITLSHVIEHLHDPVGTLKECYSRLNRGGFIWIETPNIDALGLQRYGPHWRGLEPPRHLILFNRQSLKQALADAGFGAIEELAQPSVVEGLWTMSERIARGVDPYAAEAVSPALAKEMKRAAKIEERDPTKREFLLMKARRV
jgi:2-polyprenyl-3-methyl-5-hydroxy-6-metoxy-1,4-benzoquinol methylase